ncbi:hypothetical protein DL769_002187 [Monosporascus sp. CRB-8-3]|nr:hypothetical protein DL769_002187 [Monosporascus sp. CRB-8-3]
MAVVPRYALEVAVVLKCGVGLHVEEVVSIGGPGILVVFPKLVYIIDLLWVTLVSLVKISILHFYLTIFRQTPFIRAVYIVIGLCVAFWFGAFFGTAFFCNPPKKLWLPETPGHCGDSNALYTSCASSDLAIDIIVILLPMPVLWGLQLPRAKKIALTFVFGMGFMIIAITAVRIKFMLELDYTDPTYTVSNMAVFSAMVPLLGIVNANLPVAPPAIKRMFKSFALVTTIKGSNDTGSSRHGFGRLTEPEIPLENWDDNHSSLQKLDGYGLRLIGNESFDPDP